MHLWVVLLLLLGFKIIEDFQINNSYQEGAAHEAELPWKLVIRSAFCDWKMESGAIIWSEKRGLCR